MSAGNKSGRRRIRPARADDLAALLLMLDEAVAWMVARGQSGQWGEEPWSAAEKGRSAARAMVEGGGLHVLEVDGVVAGALEVGDAGEHARPVEAPELYVRLLITSRAHAGESLGRCLIGKALDLAREQGAEILRVDCWAGAPTLVAWYESCGFRRSHTFTTAAGWRGQVLEQAVRRDAPPSPPAARR